MWGGLSEAEGGGGRRIIAGVVGKSTVGVGRWRISVEGVTGDESGSGKISVEGVTGEDNNTVAGVEGEGRMTVAGVDVEAGDEE